MTCAVLGEPGRVLWALPSLSEVSGARGRLRLQGGRTPAQLPGRGWCMFHSQTDPGSRHDLYCSFLACPRRPALRQRCSRNASRPSVSGSTRSIRNGRCRASPRFAVPAAAPGCLTLSPAPRLSALPSPPPEGLATPVRVEVARDGSSRCREGACFAAGGSL